MSRSRYVTATCAAALAVGALSLFDPRPRLLWNTTASVPTGLYRIAPVARPHRGDLLAVKPPPALALYLARRHYLPLNVPLLKHVGALPGQQVCRRGDRISVDGRIVAAALERDRFGRLLPVWTGCRRLAKGDLFLLNADVRDSLDGRYFGVLPTQTILGQATPLWTDPPRKVRATAP